MLSFAYRRFDGKGPEPGPFDAEDQALLDKVDSGFETVGELYKACKFGAAPSATLRTCLGDALALAREADGHTFATLPSASLGTGSAGLDRKAPWFQIREDPADAATTVYVTLRAVDNLKTLLAPTLCLPHNAQKLHEYLGYEGRPFGSAPFGGPQDRQGMLFGGQHVVEYQEETRSHAALTYDNSEAIGTWSPIQLPPGQSLRQPALLFKKLDESLVEEEYARLEG